MKRKLGNTLLLLGLLLICFSFLLFSHNEKEAMAAEENAKSDLTALKEEITEAAGKVKEEAPDEIDGYIGFLSIPSLDMELPVRSEWSYENLKRTPCRQFGKLSEDNLVIAGHNYKKHFLPLENIEKGDRVFFTDTIGERHDYEVITVDMLEPQDVEKVENSGHDLTMYTCNRNGRMRIGVFCDRV